jgi:flagellar motor switch/type III secretory pathway protein FliN
MRFEARSTLAIGAACLVANGVRETLASVLGASAAVHLLEPQLPQPQAWQALVLDAYLWRVRGGAGDAAFVLRADDALALAAAAFGEEAAAPRRLSPVETEVVDRAIRALAPALAPVCGAGLSPVERIFDIRGYATYFELLVASPAQFRLGVALAQDPPGAVGPPLRIEDLLDVEVELSVEFARASVDAAAFLALGTGAEVPMNTRMAEPGLLKAGSAVFARGRCGALGERAAMLVGV